MPEQNIVTLLGKYSSLVEQTIEKIHKEKIIERIWKKDHKVWSSDPTEISNRLGWLDSPNTTLKAFDEISDFVEALREEGFTNALLMGMGGSSLAPEVFRFMFGVKPGYLNLSVLDSTDPGAVKHYMEKYNPSNTIYIVSTKSGGTVETFSFMKFFYNYVVTKTGKEKAGRHFIAITDPGSGLEAVAKDFNFRKIFLNDPNIGGRYSALSLFGCVPAAMIGVDLPKLLKKTQKAFEDFRQTENNSAALLGAILAELAMIGKDKITLLSSVPVSFLGAWIEQLIAESTGKNGKGILPVVGEEIHQPEYYGHDRMFIYSYLKGEDNLRNEINELLNAGFPLIEIALENICDLGVEFLRWEIATVIAGWRSGIQPFDQPNVESAKVLARQMVKSYQEKGKLPELDIAFEEKGITIYKEASGTNLNETMINFLRKMDPGDEEGKGRSYIAIQAFVKPDDETTKVLQQLRTAIQKKFAVAVTIGYGPRFLHSTGQLHKGDSGNGLFIQILSHISGDLPIPDNPGDEKTSITFGILLIAQALGDRQALLDSNRRVLTINAGNDVVKGITLLTDSIL